MRVCRRCPHFTVCVWLTLFAKHVCERKTRTRLHLHVWKSRLFKLCCAVTTVTPILVPGVLRKGLRGVTAQCPEKINCFPSQILAVSPPDYLPAGPSVRLLAAVCHLRKLKRQLQRRNHKCQPSVRESLCRLCRSRPQFASPATDNTIWAAWRGPGFKNPLKWLRIRLKAF